MENFIQNKFGYCFYEVDKDAIIFNLYVDPDYRRCGNAKKLLKYVINEIRELGHCGDILIEALPKDGISRDDLILFYERMG